MFDCVGMTVRKRLRSLVAIVNGGFQIHGAIGFFIAAADEQQGGPACGNRVRSSHEQGCAISIHKKMARRERQATLDLCKGATL